MPKLDLKNRKILYELYNNARISSKALAKKVGLSREVVDYRVKKLAKEGFIRGYITMVNFDALGYSMYSIYINLQDLDKESEKGIMEYLAQHPYVKWLVTCSGKWDILIQVAARDKVHLDNMLTGIFSKLKPHLGSYEILTSIKRCKDVDIVLLTPYKDKMVGAANAKECTDPKLTKEDVKILGMLAENAKLNLVDVAKKVGLTAEAVSYRLKRLQACGIIRSFRTVIDASKLGHLWYTLLLDVSPMSPAMEKSTATFCSANPKIFFTDKTLGRWNLRVELFAENHVDFHRTLRKIRNHFKGALKSYELLIMFEEFKQVSLTRGMVKDLG